MFLCLLPLTAQNDFFLMEVGLFVDGCLPSSLGYFPPGRNQFPAGLDSISRLLAPELIQRRMTRFFADTDYAHYDGNPFLSLLILNCCDRILSEGQ